MNSWLYAKFYQEFLLLLYLITVEHNLSFKAMVEMIERYTQYISLFLKTDLGGKTFHEVILLTEGTKGVGGLLFFNNAKANFNASNRGAVSFVSL
jgi:hypothetical protein